MSICQYSDQKKYAADTAYFIKALNTVFTAIPPAVPPAELALAPLAADYPFEPQAGQA